MRSAVALALVATALAAGCEEETSGLLDGGFEITYCTGFALSLDEQGQVSRIDVRCARGAVCGTGLTYQSCVANEDGTATDGQDTPPDTVMRAMAANPTYPYCTPDSVGCPHCFLEPGCEEPKGLCCSTCDREGFLASGLCMRTPGCQLTYCGCDGLTYEGLPTQPYQHPGPCE
ncbi:MAG: hypothetical protein KC933_37635 [Myxococcales bacterium]|nr:hypothetical protein [Myxococcales bacterium]MCB9651128.1 hypothetical protein [Deltaproteobacteria bacterium]